MDIMAVYLPMVRQGVVRHLQFLENKIINKVNKMELSGNLLNKFLKVYKKKLNNY